MIWIDNGTGSHLPNTEPKTIDLLPVGLKHSSKNVKKNGAIRLASKELRSTHLAKILYDIRKFLVWLDRPPCPNKTGIGIEKKVITDRIL